MTLAANRLIHTHTHTHTHTYIYFWKSPYLCDVFECHFYVIVRVSHYVMYDVPGPATVSPSREYTTATSFYNLLNKEEGSSAKTKTYVAQAVSYQNILTSCLATAKL